ncbi:MAG: hypothetical protein V4660_00705 [Pseudomonadota bacterium]
MKKILYSIFVVGIFIIIRLTYSVNSASQIDGEHSGTVEDISSASFNQERQKNIAAPRSTSAKSVTHDIAISNLKMKNKGWDLQKLSSSAEASIRMGSSIESGVVEKININIDLIKSLLVDDVINFDLPGNQQSVKVKVTSVSTNNDIKTIVGSIEELGIGYGITLSQSGEILVGDVITQYGSWSIDTVSGVTFITNGRKSEGLDQDVVQ